MEQIRINAKSFETDEVKQLTRDELAKIKADPLVYPLLSEQLKLTAKEAEAYIGDLLDYRDDVHYCANCPGLGHCHKARPHFVIRLAREGRIIVRHYDPCEKMLSLASFKERYLRCDFPEDWRDASLNEVERSVARNEAITAMAVSLTKRKKWIYLTGNSGSGKTYLLAAYANFVTTHEGSGVFVDTGRLLNELKEKSINDHDGFERLFRSICDASVVVFDGFGNEFVTEYAYLNFLYPVLSYRDQRDLLTAFASDFSLRQVTGIYKNKIGAERAGQLERLLSRRIGKELDVSGLNFH